MASTVLVVISDTTLGTGHLCSQLSIAKESLVRTDHNHLITQHALRYQAACIRLICHQRARLAASERVAHSLQQSHQHSRSMLEAQAISSCSNPSQHITLPCLQPVLAGMSGGFCKPTSGLIWLASGHSWSVNPSSPIIYVLVQRSKAIAATWLHRTPYQQHYPQCGVALLSHMVP